MLICLKKKTPQYLTAETELFESYYDANLQTDII